MVAEDYINHIGKTIKYFREAKGLKQVELASMVGIEDSALRRIEKGRTNPTIKTLYSICDALDIALEYLFLENDEERMVLSNYRVLTDQEKNLKLTKIKPSN